MITDEGTSCESEDKLSGGERDLNISFNDILMMFTLGLSSDAQLILLHVLTSSRLLCECTFHVVFIVLFLLSRVLVCSLFGRTRGSNPSKISEFTDRIVTFSRYSW